MNDHELDRLVASAAPVRDSWVAGLDLRDAEDELMEEIMATANTQAPPASGPSTDRSSPFGGEPRRFKLAVAVGLAAALLVGVVVVRSTTGSGDDDGDVRTPGEPTIMPMIADSVPDGFEVGLVVPEEGLLPEPSTPGGPIDTWIYGDLTATALTNDVLLSIAASAPEGTSLSEPVTVRGRQGSLCSPGPHQCDLGNNITGVSWTEASGLYVTVESRSFDRTQLLAIAEGVTVDGNTVELGSVPAGVTKPPKVAELDHDWAWTYMVQYSSPDARSFSVATKAETEASHIYDLWFSGPRDDLDVQGHDASIDDLNGSHVLTWEPVPGQLVEVLTNGVDETAALAFAETVRPATTAEWAHVQELFADAPPDDERAGTEPPPDDAAHRELADGTTEVWGWLGEDGGLCYEVNDHGALSSQLCTGEPTKVLGVSPTNDSGTLIWDVPAAVGVAPEATTSIDGGEVTLGEQVDGGRLFVWEFPDGEMPDSLTFRDADGNEIATSDVLIY